ncbi:MAG: response regulator transcription factor [Bdellovibrio sp.]|nr:response regulator transcription factor [Bdellovibrio sp.]
MHKILIVEDDSDLKDLITHTLGPAYNYSWAADLKSAQQEISKGALDLIILDVHLPDGNGFQFFSYLLNDSNFQHIPVIFLTATDSLSDKVLGLSLGAEDYITKPFQPAELKARIEMRLKKYDQLRKREQIIRSGQLELNLTSQKAYSVVGNEKVNLALTALETKLLALFMSNDDQVFARSQILDKIWGSNTFLSDRGIDSHVYSLRKKMGAHGSYIQSVYGEGYRFSTKDAIGLKKQTKIKEK